MKNDHLNSLRKNFLVIFLHIPKTAGTTLKHILKLKYLSSCPSYFFNHRHVLGYYNIYEHEERIQCIKNLSKTQRRKVSYFEGHYGYGVHKLFPQRSLYITLLRDPLERMLSTYYHFQDPINREMHNLPKNVSLMKLLSYGQSFNAHFFDNAQVRYLAGEDGNFIEEEPNKLNPEMLEVAKSRLSQNNLIFGLTEHFDESLLLFQRKLGWTSPFYVSSNVSKIRKNAEQPSGDEIDLIKKLNKLDIKLYQYALNKFELEIKQYGMTFWNDLKKFKQLNRVYQKFFAPIYKTLPKIRSIMLKL
jgi:hypothetical protein